jgi:dihydrodipicolinate synthase/N-acetylneuraminate lyase
MPDIEQIKKDLRGPMMPIITCFKDDLSLDLETIQDNVRFLIDGGITTGQGVMLAVGAGGDFPMMTVDERRQTAQAIVEAADGKAPVLIGVQDTDPRVSIELAEFSREIGAYGIQASPTYYYEPADADVIAFYASLNNAAQIPIMVYNTPWLVNYNMSFAVLDALADMEWIVALKWAHPSVYGYTRGVERFADKLAIVDNYGLAVLSHMLGATGFITHLANIWPEHEVALWKQMDAGDYAGAQAELQRVNWRWLDFRAKMAGITGGEANVVKAAYELIGRRGGPVRPPTRDMSVEHRAEFKALLKEIGVPGVQE